MGIITANFSFIGRLYDKDGNYGKPWWTDHAVKEFTAKEKCFIEEYSNFSIQKKHVSLYPTHIRDM